jgi:hypothetical protein
VSLKRAGDRFDARVAGLAERIARRVSRRDAVRGALLGSATGLAALALGESPAQAQSCMCGPTRRCSGCRLCKGSFTSNCFNNQGYRCEWPQGLWIACMGQGSGLGYRVCYDCINHEGCPDWCTCLSSCVCCHCETVSDVRSEQHRLQQVQVP